MKTSSMDLIVITMSDLMVARCR